MNEGGSFFPARWPAAVSAGPFLFFSGQMGQGKRAGALALRYEEVDARGPGANTSFAWVAGMEAPVGAQAIAIYERYRHLLGTEGGDLSHLLRYHIYQRDKHFFSVFDRTRRAYETAPPTSTAVGMGRFEPTDTATLCVDAIALRPNSAPALGERKVLGGSLPHAAAAHFSHVVGTGPYIFVAGQIPVDTSKPGSPLIRGYDDIPEEGRFLRVGRSHEDARNGPIAAQSWFTYDLIRQHLERVGSSMDEILNVIVYLQDMRDFPTFHRVHERFFKSSPPAMTVIEVAEVGHKGTLIEIEPTAVRAGFERKAHQPRNWQAPALMSGTVSAGGLAFLSGVVGVDASSSAAVSTEAQCVAALDALTAQLAAAGGTLERVAHLTVYLRTIDDFATVERVLVQRFGTWRPALTALEVAAPAPVRAARLSLTAIAWLGDGQLEAKATS